MKYDKLFLIATILLINALIIYPTNSILAQRIVQVPQGIGTLNAAIDGDTLANGQRVDQNTIYELQRDGYYILLGTLQNLNYHLHIRAASGSGKKPIIRPGVPGNGISGRPFQARANLTLEGIYICNLDDQNVLLQNIIRLSEDNITLTINNSHLDRDLQSAVRCDGKNQKIIIKNSIISNIGTMQSPDNGRGVDDRGNDIDILIMQNNTFYNITSRILRDGGGIIKYLLVEHNTIVNVAQMGCSIGSAIEAHFRNNLLINTGFLGRSSSQTWVMLETAATSQSWLDQGFTQRLMIHNNNFYVDPQLIAAIPTDRTPTPVFNDHALAAVNAGNWGNTIFNLAVAFTVSPQVPVNVLTDYFNAAVAQKSDMDNGGGSPDFGKVQMPFNFSYPTNSVLYVSGTNGMPLGDLSWFQDKKNEYDQNVSLTLLQPNGGENWRGGAAQKISWTSNNIDNIRIEYTSDNGQSWNEISGNASASQGYFNWNTPNISSVNCKVRLTSTANNNITAISTGTFTISEAELYSISVTANPDNGGSTTGGGNYFTDNIVTVSANVNPGFAFMNWTESGNIVSTNSSYTFTVNRNRSLIANFTNSQFTVSTTSFPTNSGFTTGDGTYLYGSEVTVYATPNTNYVFTNWTENGTVVSTQMNYTFTINSNRNLTANFLTKPDPPLALAPGNISQTSFRANWQESNNTSNYFLDVALDLQFNNILSSYNNRSVGNSISHIVTNLIPNSTFYYRVRASNIAGTSASSNVVIVTTLPVVPTAPAALPASEINNNSFKANWSQVLNATKYFIDVAIDNSFANILSNYNNKDVGNVTSYSITNLVTNFTYIYRVRAYNSGGTSGNSNSIAVTVITGMDDGITPDKFDLRQNYPNPFNPTTEIQFSIPKSVPVLLVVYNIIGEVVGVLINSTLSPAIYSTIFNAKDLPNGIYLYKIQAGEFVQTKKMILLK